MFLIDRPSNFAADPNIFMPKKIDRQNPEIRLISVFVSDFNNKRTVAILTLFDERLIEMDLLKTGFLFEFSSFALYI